MALLTNCYKWNTFNCGWWVFVDDIMLDLKSTLWRGSGKIIFQSAKSENRLKNEKVLQFVRVLRTELSNLIKWYKDIWITYYEKEIKI